MWQVAALYLVVHFSTSLADDHPTCNSDGPGNCTFEGAALTECSWTFGSNEIGYDTYSGVKSAVFRDYGPPGANMTSRTACSTRGDTHCLKVRYLLQGTNITGLNVYARYGGNEDLVFSSADRGLNKWYAAEKPITINDNFRIILEGRKYLKGTAYIYIDYIRYLKYPCQRSQTSAEPSSVPTILVTEKRTTTTPGLDASAHATTGKTVSNTEEKTTISDVHVYVSTDASTGNAHSVASDVGVVVGVVVAAIVIAVVVVIFILYRRNRLHLWKRCFRNENKNDNAASGTSQNGERTVGREDRRTVNSVNATPTVSGYENHPFTLTGPQSSVSYYNVIKDADGAGDSAAPQYSNMHGSQSAECGKESNSSTFVDIDPYEIKGENGNLPSAATRNPNPNTHPKGTRRQYQNYPVPACDRDKSQATSDYSLASATGAEATGVYHYPEEDPRNPGEGGETALYQYAKDPDVNREGSVDAQGVYHILERDSTGSQTVSAYHVPKGGKAGQQHTPTVKVSKGQTGNYNTLDFAGNSSGQKNDGGGSGGVYNHLNAGSDDPYNEVDREKRPEVIDDEYSHISSKATVC